MPALQLRFNWLFAAEMSKIMDKAYLGAQTAHGIQRVNPWRLFQYTEEGWATMTFGSLWELSNDHFCFIL